MRPSEFPTLPLKRLMRPTSAGAVSIKGHLDDLANNEGFPGYSASGQDVRLPEPQFNGEGLVLSAVGAQCGKCFYASGQWGVVANTQVFLPTERGDARYLFYLANQRDFWDVGGTAQPYVQVPRSMSQAVPAPPLNTQRRIARFLDEKTARIDGLIKKKRELLDRLAEKRQALITHAVTKGLNPDVPMKPSGIDWLGNIPAHWEALPLRRVTFRVATGRTPPSTNTDYFTDGSLNWFTPGDFSTNIELSESTRKVTPKAIEDGVCTLFSLRTVFLIGIGATLGKVAVSRARGSANQQINAILPNQNNDPYFMAYFLHGFREEVRVTSNSNTLGILNQEGTKSLMMPIPPLPEQVEIASKLRDHDSRQAEVDLQIEKSIGLLRTYRSALITAAVTGQIAELQ